MDPEKGPKQLGVTTAVQGVTDDEEVYDDNGGLHRSLGGRHLQVRPAVMLNTLINR